MDDQSGHPPDSVAKSFRDAEFWYNPNAGRFRARVPPQFSNRETLKLYNQINGTHLLRLPDDWVHEPYENIRLEPEAPRQATDIQTQHPPSVDTRYSTPIPETAEPSTNQGERPMLLKQKKQRAIGERRKNTVE